MDRIELINYFSWVPRLWEFPNLKVYRSVANFKPWVRVRCMPMRCHLPEISDLVKMGKITISIWNFDTNPMLSCWDISYLKKPTIFFKKLLFFSILYLEKEKNVCFWKLQDILNIVRPVYEQSFKLEFLSFDFLWSCIFQWQIQETIEGRRSCSEKYFQVYSR